MPSFLLDTNIVSDLMRNPGGRVAERIAQIGDQAVCSSIVVVAEIRSGIAKSRSRRLASRLAAILPGIEVFPFEAPADETYGALRAELERTGGPIGANDMLIAAQALSLGLTLVTDNEREFARVSGLKVENWLRLQAGGED
jgi:tRNA(fMet)-specific endonuclease VapC